MNYLIVCREYPPAPAGGIGVYAAHLARLLAERGETVHVIGQRWAKTDDTVEVQCGGHLLIHRVPYEDGASLFPRRRHPALNGQLEQRLFASEYPPQCFSWRASLLAEKLVEEAGIHVIEAQEYEAPLYFFQLRRAIGLGPRRRPPCVIHLHSPTEFIARHNAWDLSRPGVVIAKRLEDYSIAAADALLCPSHYLARQAEQHYGLAPGAIAVVPYPLGDTRSVSRAPSTWQHGTICFVGRLEPRKGVFEWVEAAIRLAREHSKPVRFDFIGADTIHQGTSVRALLERRIPHGLRASFRFLGERPRSLLTEQLATARAAVVPSRWENFPYSCIEAMAAGLPVIATREGGMAEMIEEGRSGWLAETVQPEHLAAALRRALATSPSRLAGMGTNAAAQIHRLCGNDQVVAARRSLHRLNIKQGATQSAHLPLNLLSRGRRSGGHGPRRPPANSPTGIAVLITSPGDSGLLDNCLQSIALQTQKPVGVRIASHASVDDRSRIDQTGSWPFDIQVLGQNYDHLVDARNAAITALLGDECPAHGVALLSDDMQLMPTYIEVCDAILKLCPEVGLISCWSADSKAGKSGWVRPCPSFPYQWTSNDAAPFSVVRTEALREVGSFRSVLNSGYDQWDFVNAVLAGGWVAITVPEVLVQHRYRETPVAELANCDRTTRSELLGRFPDLVARDGPEIVRLALSHSAKPSRARAIWADRLSRAKVMLRYPRSTARQVYGRLRNKALRFAQEFANHQS